MNKTGISSLRLVYEISNRYEAAYISEFFKMCGFMVSEQEVPQGAAKYETLIKQYDMFDCNFFLIDKIDYEEYFDLDCRNSHGKLSRLCGCPDFLDAYKKKNYNYLKERLKRVVDAAVPKMQAFPGLLDIFVEKEYCRWSYIKRYFLKGIDSEEKKELHRRFLEIYFTLQSISEEADEMLIPYYRHAGLLCARKVNDICCELDWNYYFPPEQMIERCASVSKRYISFPAMDALAASFCACEPVLSNGVISFYQDALDKGQESQSLANVYYRLGRYFEKNKADMKKAYEIYEKGAVISPKYFRIIFKMGSKYLEENKYKSSIDKYEQIINILKCKRNSKKLFPVEFEYLCKCYLMVGLIYHYYWEDEFKAGQYYKQAIELIETELDNSDFFKVFLLDETSHYLKIVKKRIALREKVLVSKYK